jgi:hypothetical protein
MDQIFNFQKSEKSSFEIKEASLEQLKMPGMGNESMSLIDETPLGYEDPRWIEKSNSIKARDNYTCQLCHTFNPSLGDFIFVKQGEYDTIHHYYWAGTSKYDIQVRGYILIITFDFLPGFHLAMPRLNVHHKIYYRNRNLWDYPDDCLVTLCEDCHHYVHSLNDIGIPIVEEHSDGKTTLIGKTRPKQYQPILDHTDLGTFHPLALVEENRWGLGLKGQDLIDYKRAEKENKQWFEYHNILDNNVVRISYFTAENRHMIKRTPEEIEKAANFIIKDFLENILGFSKIKQ